MTNTPNFNLNIVEGSDVVNPLIQFNPNFETIDETMEDNRNSGITTATEVFSGNIHALNRKNKKCPVFRFQATANYSTGDIFTVDGQQVSALLTDGTNLPAGAFVINSNVLCVVVGAVMTVYVAGGSATVAKDAEKLGGNAPGYYATAEQIAGLTAQLNAVVQIANNALPAASAQNFLRVARFDSASGTLELTKGV